MKQCSVIIVAAGSSRRFGFDKLMADLGGKPVLRRTIEAFSLCPEVGEIILVTPESRFLAVTQGYQTTSIPLVRANGGTERHFSVMAGLKKVSQAFDYVAVHDGARPLISTQAIRKCLEVAQSSGAATCAHPIVDTLKRSDGQGHSGLSVDRQDLWAMETPQIFKKSLLLQAYEAVIKQGSLVTDEVSALETIGIPTTLVANDTPNLKITHPGDLNLAAHLISTIL